MEPALLSLPLSVLLFFSFCSAWLSWKTVNNNNNNNNHHHHSGRKEERLGSRGIVLAMEKQQTQTQAEQKEKIQKEATKQNKTCGELGTKWMEEEHTNMGNADRQTDILRDNAGGWGGGTQVHTNEKNNDRQDGKTEEEQNRLAWRCKI